LERTRTNEQIAQDAQTFKAQDTVLILNFPTQVFNASTFLELSNR